MHCFIGSMNWKMAITIAATAPAKHAFGIVCHETNCTASQAAVIAQNTPIILWALLFIVIFPMECCCMVILSQNLGTVPPLRYPLGLAGTIWGPAPEGVATTGNAGFQRNRVHWSRSGVPLPVLAVSAPSLRLIEAKPRLFNRWRAPVVVLHFVLKLNTVAGGDALG